MKFLGFSIKNISSDIAMAMETASASRYAGKVSILNGRDPYTIAESEWTEATDN